MSKTISKLGVTIPERESYVYSAYFQNESTTEGTGVPAYGEVYNSFPSTPTWTRTGVGKFEAAGFGVPMTTKSSQEVMISRVPYTGTEGYTDNWHPAAGLKVGGGGVTVWLYDTSFALTDTFGAFYLTVRVYV